MPAKLHVVGIVSRLWLGDTTIRKLPLAGQGFLWRLHLLAVDRGTWPDIPADGATIALMLGMNPRPVDRLLNMLKAEGFVVPISGDPTRRRLGHVDAVVQWRPLNELT